MPLKVFSFFFETFHHFSNYPCPIPYSFHLNGGDLPNSSSRILQVKVQASLRRFSNRVKETSQTGFIIRYRAIRW
jgi:hypothetical protein